MQQEDVSLDTAEQRDRLLDMVENLSIECVFVNGDEVVMNAAAARLTGYEAPEIASLSDWFEKLYGSRAAEVREIYEEDKSHGFPEKRQVYLTTGSGEVKFVEFAGYQNVAGEIWILSDLTPWKRAEKAFRASESTRQAILSTCIDGIITIDPDGRILSLNPAVEKIFDYDSDELIGENISRLMTEPDRDRHGEYLKRYIETGVAKIMGMGREVVGRRKDGTQVPIQLGVGEMRTSEGTFFVGVVRDLTSFKEVERRLIEAESLASLGEMAASVAHEIKNPLAAISGVVQVLRDAKAIEEEYGGIIDELVERVARLDDTVNRLLVFAKPIRLDPRFVDLTELTTQIVNALRAEERFKSFRCVVQESEPHEARVDIILYEDLLRNLMNNAADAMAPGGEITVALETRDERNLVLISDTGAGMEEDVLKRVFEPFFTTRASGTGLGLAIGKKIVEAHGGTISMHSEPRRGSCVCLSFPRVTGRYSRKKSQPD